MLVAAHAGMKAGQFTQVWNTILQDIRRMPPEAVAAITSLALLIPFCIGLTLYSGHLAQEANARAVAAQETAGQLAAEMEAQLKARAAPVAPAKPAEPAPARAPGGYPLMGKAFVDHFQEIGRGWSVSDGWSNGDWMENDWRAGQVQLTPEGLRLTLGPSPEGAEKPLSGGEIRTNEMFRYGYFEIRMRTPRDPGLVVGAFAYAPRDERRRPNEIDIEIIGRATRKAELTVHQNSRAASEIVTLPFDSADGFHTYAFDWRPDSVNYYIDGKLAHRETGGSVSQLNRPQQFIISLWASRQLREWVGDLDASHGPWRLDVSCVAYSPEEPVTSLCLKERVHTR